MGRGIDIGMDIGIDTGPEPDSGTDCAPAIGIGRFMLWSVSSDDDAESAGRCERRRLIGFAAVATAFVLIDGSDDRLSSSCAAEVMSGSGCCGAFAALLNGKE